MESLFGAISSSGVGIAFSFVMVGDTLGRAKKKSNAGAIAGIVIGVVVAVLALMGLSYYAGKKNVLDKVNWPTFGKKNPPAFTGVAETDTTNVLHEEGM